MFEGLWGRKFNAKCKSAVKSTMARIEMVRNRRKAMQNFLTNDIADLLRRGFDTNAYSKAEGLCAELNKISCYDFIDQFCGCILDNLSAMNKERGCPKECREAVSSLIFAAARMAEVPELKHLRTILNEKYAPESFVNKEFSEMLESRSSSKDMKLQLLQDIAQQSSIEWDSKALEQKLFNPPASDQDQKSGISSKGEDVARKEEDEEDPSWNGKRNDVGNGFRLHFGWRNTVPETPSFAPREDINGGHRDFSSSERKVPEKEMDERQPFSKRLVPPPYTRSKSEEIDNKHEGIQTGTDSPVQGEVAKNPNAAQVGEGEAKPSPIPRSVRTRQMNPPPAGQDEGAAESVKTYPRRTRLENPKRGLQILTAMNGDQKEEAELDRLLIHYSTKKPSHEPPPPPTPPVPPQEENKHHPSRARSLQLERTAQTDDTRKGGHLRANSLQPDMLKGGSHVHPKLPDYEEVAAFLAAFRRK